MRIIVIIIRFILLTIRNHSKSLKIRVNNYLAAIVILITGFLIYNHINMGLDDIIGGCRVGIILVLVWLLLGKLNSEWGFALANTGIYTKGKR